MPFLGDEDDEDCLENDVKATIGIMQPQELQDFSLHNMDQLIDSMIRRDTFVQGDSDSSLNSNELDYNLKPKRSNSI